MLGPYRVLDLCDERGEMAPLMLGDLGADVLKIEPSGGSPARRAEPRLPDGPGQPPDAERSLSFFAYNQGKRSLVLDLDRSDERDALLRLVAGADFVLDSGPDGPLERAGIDFDALRAANPRSSTCASRPSAATGRIATSSPTIS